MNSVERDLDRVLMLLRNKIRERGYTQLQVQEQLEWGRSYISQLLTKQKSLRVEQVLLILAVIGIDPSAFYSELYRFPPGDAVSGKGAEYASAAPGQAPYNSGHVADAGGLPLVPIEQLRADLQRSQQMLGKLIQLLVDKSVLSEQEVEALRLAIGSEAVPPDTN